MKKIIYTIFAVILIAAATLKASAQSDETRQVSGFSSIASYGPFNIHVKIDGTESLKISASTDVIKEMETVVEDGKLKIKFKTHIQWNEENYGKIDIYLLPNHYRALPMQAQAQLR